MADAPKPPGPIRFPGGRPGVPSLSLPRRRPSHSPLELSEASAEARKQISEIMTVTRTPWAEGALISPEKASELEKALRQLESKLAERERLVEDLEFRLAEKERELAETETLLMAREKLVAARRAPSTHSEISAEEQQALVQLRAELERQEASLEESKAAVKEREAFLDDSESRLFEKVQSQQEKETELEQREEDLRKRERQVQEKLAAVDPAAAEALRQADSARKRDEFNE